MRAPLLHRPVRLPQRIYAILVPMAVLGGIASCREDAGPQPAASGTTEMVERLRVIAAGVDPQNDKYVNDARVEAMMQLGTPSDLSSRWRFNAELGQELLRAGRLEEAIQRLQHVLREVDASQELVPANFAHTVRSVLALAHLRRAQQNNCIQPASIVHCLVPPGERGVYANRIGLEEAVNEYHLYLQADPGNRLARWLLNTAYMALGQYPDGVPAPWLIPPEAFRAEYDVKRFHDVAPELGVDILGHAGGSVMEDFDGDGYLDIMASSRGLGDQLRIFRNNRDGTFSDRTETAGLDGLVGGINLIQADYNNDGHIDVFVLRGGWLREGQPNSLLRNNGDGTFEDVTARAGLLEPFPTQTGAWGDFDNDGWVDLFLGNETTVGPDNPTQLFRNNGDGSFTDVAQEVGAAVIAFAKGVVWGDVNNDGRLDLYISRLDGPNMLLENRGPDATGHWAFTDVAQAAGVTQPLESFPTWFWDYDNDGWLDLFVSGRKGSIGDVVAEFLGSPHQAETPRLYHNNGDGTFADVTERSRTARVMLAMGGNFGDLDNDGFLDFYVGTGDPDLRAMIPNRMFRNADGEFFQEVTTSGGFGHLQKGHGVAFGDWDNDGDQDLYVVLGAAYEGDVAYNVLFENPGHGNGWITLKLEGVQTNRAAIGARVQVSVETGAGVREIHRVVGSGGSFGASSLQQEIGLGRATGVRAVRVTWPATGRSQLFSGLEMNRIYRLKEGDPTPVPVALERVPLSRD